MAQVETPAVLQEQLRDAMQEAGIPVPDSEERWQQALRALKVRLTPSWFERRSCQCHCAYACSVRNLPCPSMLRPSQPGLLVYLCLEVMSCELSDFLQEGAIL